MADESGDLSNGNILSSSTRGNPTKHFQLKRLFGIEVVCGPRSRSALKIRRTPFPATCSSLQAPRQTFTLLQRWCRSRFANGDGPPESNFRGWPPNLACPPVSSACGKEVSAFQTRKTWWCWPATFNAGPAGCFVLARLRCPVAPKRTIALFHPFCPPNAFASFSPYGSATCAKRRGWVKWNWRAG